jgi:hypothetical protein
VPFGSLANALSLGAKTVNGPLPFRASISPALVSAVARVLNWPAETAVEMMSSPCACLSVAAQLSARAVVASRAVIREMRA